tara:strand:+ start:462 stop:800 length:339 start_codon:yes stop_codon:yes gene_type:complete
VIRTISGSLFDLAPSGVYKLSQSPKRLVVSYTTLSALLEICQNKSISGLLSAALSISIRLLPLGGTLFCGARTFLSDIQSNHSIFSDYQKTGEIKGVIQKIQVRNFNIYFFK